MPDKKITERESFRANVPHEHVGLRLVQSFEASRRGRPFSRQPEGEFSRNDFYDGVWKEDKKPKLRIV